MKEEIEKLEKEVKELKSDLKFAKMVEMEAVHRYRKVADELLIYYLNYGILKKKEKKKWNINSLK